MAQVPIVEDNYIGNGANRVFGLTWPYLSPTEVFVSVDGVNVPFAWLSGSASSVQTVTAPPNGSAVRVYRSTRAEAPLHKFSNGVPFLPRYVDENNEQVLYALQEGLGNFSAVAADAAEALAGVTVAAEAAVAANAAAATALENSTIALDAAAEAQAAADSVEALAGPLTEAVNAAVAGVANKQDKADNLTALSGLTGLADKFAYFTGAGAMALATLTAQARTFLAATTAAAQRVALGLGSSATRDTRLLLTETLAPATYDDGYVAGLRAPQMTGNGNGNKFNYYSVNITDDQAVQQGGLGSMTGSKVQGFGVRHVFGGPTTRGGRHAIDGTLLQGFGGAGITDPNNQDRFYVGVQGQVLSDTGDGGTGPLDCRGNYFGASAFSGILGGGYVNNLTGCEFNTQINVGTGAYAGKVVRMHTGIQIASAIGERGFDFDAAVSVSNLGGSLKSWKDGVAFHGLNGAPALANDSTVIHLYPSASATASIDTLIDLRGITSAALLRTDKLVMTDLGINYNTNGAFINLGGATASTPTMTFRSSGANSTYDVRFSFTGGTSATGNGIMTIEANGVITPLIRPQVDNGVSVGLSNARYSVGYFAGGVLTTSDRNHKQNIVGIPDVVLDAVAEVRAAQYNMEELGTALRFGVIAQEVVEAFAKHGLDAVQDYAVVQFAKWDAEPAVLDDKGNVVQPAVVAGERYAVNYDQWNVLVGAVNKRRLDRLEARLAKE